jgi:hypothetical protein
LAFFGYIRLLIRVIADERPRPREAAMRVPAHPTLIRRMLDARLKQLLTAQPVLSASLVQTAKHCGRPSCHCLRGGPKHVGNYVTCKIAGKTRTVYVPLDLVTEVRSWIAEHHRLKRLLHEIQLLSLALIRQHAQHRNRRRGRR